MITKQDPQRIIATNIRTTAALLEEWREEYANTYPAHRLSFNAWIIELVQRGRADAARRIKK